MNTQIYSEMYILGCILNNFDDTDFIIETLEDFVQGKGQFPGLRGIPADYLLNELKVHLINADFVGVSLTDKGVQALCLEWLEKKKHQGNDTEAVPDQVNPFPEIFTDEGYRLFCYLEKNYNSDNKFLKAKYSWLYHFLKEQEAISCKVKEYAGFLREERQLKFGRLQARQYKYDESVKPKLRNFTDAFKRDSKIQ